MEEFSGYSSKVRQLLESEGINPFDLVALELKDGRKLEGVVLPRPHYGNPDTILLKLGNGYNVGFHVDNVRQIRLVARYKPSPLVPLRKPELRPGLPKVVMLGTGGTIASRIDYQTGAVYPFFTAEEIYSMLPELEDMAVIDARTVFNIFSEDMTAARWEKLAEEIARAFEREMPAGVIIAHGTDTMAYTAAAMAFALRRLPGPVIFVGAQRSSDRPSSDTALNVLSAVTTAVKAPFAESVIVMHAGLNDNYCLVHRGVKCRKFHTSRRDAFRSVNDKPLAVVKPPDEVKVINKRVLPRSGEPPVLMNGFDDKTVLLKFYPGMSEEVIHFYIDKGYHGIVLEGTGLGHIATRLIKAVQRAVEEGIPVVMTSQCIWGRINMNVYRTGVELLKVGVIPGEDMLPETAFVKLSWILARERNIKEVRRMFLQNMVYEINPRSQEDFYPPLI